MNKLKIIIPTYNPVQNEYKIEILPWDLHKQQKSLFHRVCDKSFYFSYYYALVKYFLESFTYICLFKKMGVTEFIYYLGY